MTVLSDKDLVRRIKSKSVHTRLIINPCKIIRQIQPCSVDLTLNNTLRKMNGQTYSLKDDETYILQPNEQIISTTLEYLEIPEDLTGYLTGITSLNQQGITIENGLIQPGFKGNLQLSIKNNSNDNFILTSDMTIGQIILLQLSNPPARLYGDSNLNSKYQKEK